MGSVEYPPKGISPPDGGDSPGFPVGKVLGVAAVAGLLHTSSKAKVGKLFPEFISAPKNDSNGLVKEQRATTGTVGETIKTPYSTPRETPHETGNHVLVSLPDKMVVVVDGDGNTVAEYPVYIGTSKDPTPRGEFRIMENIRPAEWYYGGHWMGFAKGYGEDKSSYAGFHGWVYTKDDDDIEKDEPGWKTSTHGCVQMKNKDIANFSQLVGTGDRVTILDRPFAPPPAKPPLPTGLSSSSTPPR